MSTGSTRALRALDAAHVPYVVRPYEHDPLVANYGDEAAARLGLARQRVLKTLVVRAPHGLVVVILPVAHRLDLKALAAALGVKHVRVADPQEAERSTGYHVGGISPFGQKRALPTLVDVSVTSQRTVVVSAGKRGLAVELAVVDLISATAATVASMSREAI
ncbi:Cys-tRNA(Pro) deacylase [Aeromicrobium sp. P5_D10]